MKHCSTALLTTICALVFAANTSFAGTLFTGKLVTTEGEALIGATVLIPGTANGTMTDIDGFFQIEIPDGTDELYISIGCFGDNTMSWCGQEIGLVIAHSKRGPVSYDINGRSSCGLYLRSRKSKRFAGNHYEELLAYRDQMASASNTSQ